ncbi:MAG: AAA family ATPase [archaeon]|nr:AAA family ATPase [archaeon]
MGENIFEKELEKVSIFKDRNAISPHYTPKELPFREKQIQQITKSLSVTLRNEKADNLFIYGRTGTGKTSCTKYVLKELIEYKQKTNSNIESVYINCRNHNSKYKVLVKVVASLYPKENFLGFSAGFVYDRLVKFCEDSSAHAIIVLDEIDKVKDLDDLVYALTRSNDELEKGSISLIGISNNLMFKDRLDPRTKSALCKQELVFSPYNAEELKSILKSRVDLAFKPNTVQDSALNLAAAIAAQESGDARTAVMLLMKAGELVDNNGLGKISDEEVKKAKNLVEEEIIYDMVSTLPGQQQLVLKAITELTLNNKGVRKLSGKQEDGVLYSGEIYDHYKKIAKAHADNVVSSRWYREYITELEMYGLILTTASGAGIKGQTRLIKLGLDARKINDIIDKQLSA